MEWDLYNDRDARHKLTPKTASEPLKCDNGVDFGVLDTYSEEEYAEMINNLQKDKGCYDEDMKKLMVKLFIMNPPK